jgi:hypothetical protein
VKKIKKSKIKNKGKPDFLFALWKGTIFLCLILNKKIERGGC